ncbi:MAG TPA: glucose-1-phosphate cytidylyltransferase [Planctomycetes bacterium]|nr:glucose-1-phosphate cytidylyltransferase [Planctomycetota bacterium]HIK61433.1 glucose-1-phosphate cytidylyltransferase [Planctomycetota bacterium]
MKVGILAGGVGSRLSEETVLKPKPMVEVGGRPILWHIMQRYAAFGHTEFVVALGYKGEYIKRYMLDYCSLSSNLKVHLGQGEVIQETRGGEEDWTVELIDTGQESGTGGRIRQLVPYMGDETFMLTWGDGVSNVDLDALLDFHRSHGKLATVTAVRPPARFGLIEMDGDRVVSFSEKPQLGEGWINGAFFVFEPGIAEYVDDDLVMWEQSPMERLAADGQLMAYRHHGFWQCMDTLRHKKRLEELWAKGDAPWQA